jgi:hypothetical protein
MSRFLGSNHLLFSADTLPVTTSHIDDWIAAIPVF